MKKFLKCIVLTAIVSVLCIAIFVSGCTTTAVGIESIEYTSSDGNVDTYTIYYTDGSTSDFTVTNGTDGEDGTDGADGTDGTDGTDGKDGTDGASVTAQDLYDYYKEIYGDDLTYAEFLEKYLSLSTDNSTTINNCLLSAVSVYSEYSYSPHSSGPMSSGIKAVTYATGSGILYEKGDTYSYIVTNYHVVYEYSTSYNINGLADSIYIYLYGSEQTPTTSSSSGYITNIDYGDNAIECEYVGGSAASDIAVLRVKTSDIDAINPDFKAVTIADGYHVGQTVFTIGNAEGEGLSVTEGIVSVDSETISLSVDGTTRSYRSIRIDTAVYEGNSGGGLFNANGELVGLVNAGSTSDQNINYAIPYTIAIGTVDNIIYYYEDGDDSTTDSYGITIGITYTTQNSKYVYNVASGYGEITEEIVVSSVNESSIAETLGFESDDIITEMTITDNSGNTNTYQVTRSYIITDLILTLRAGYSISFSYTRGGTAGTTSTYTILSSDLAARG